MFPLKLEALSKSFPQSQFQLGPLELCLTSGSNVALFGKNGAGKSTLFQLLTGHTRPDAGRIELWGEPMHVDAFALKRRIGYLPQNIDLPRWVSGFDLLTYALKLHGIGPLPTKRDQILAYWDCESFAHKPLAACSYGMQKRIGLALATLHDPALLILDEPFSGLDLFHIRALEDLLDGRRGEHLTLVSTHVAAHAARISNRAFTLKDGQLQELRPWPESSYLERIHMMEADFFKVASPAHSEGKG